MNTEIIIMLTFLICFILGVLLLGWIETLIKNKNEQERYINSLENEVLHLQSVLSVLSVALQTKGGK